MIPLNLQAILPALILSLVVGTPLLMAVLCCTPLRKEVARFLPWTVVPAFFAVLTVPRDLLVEVPWFFMGGSMGLDEIGHIFLAFSSFIWFLACFNCRGLLQKNRGQVHHFLVFFLAAMAGNFGLILARDMLGYYLFFAVMSFAAYGLVVHNKTREAIKAGRIYLTLVMIGEVALFTALIVLAHHTGSLAIADIAGASCQPLALTLLFVGFGVKVGALPLHGWLVPAYQNAPIPAAAVLAGSMVNAGILGWLRFIPLGHTAFPQGAMLFIIAGALAAVYGVLRGLSHTQAGAILGCSSMSQMGLITIIFGLGLFDHQAGLAALPVLLLYVVHHGLAKSSLFFGYDVVTGQGQAVPRLQMAGILLPALALAGLPFTSGAVVKTALKALATTSGEPWSSLATFFLPLTAMGTTMLMLHFVAVLKQSEKTSSQVATGGKLVFLVSFLAVASALWLWPSASISASHSLAGVQLFQGLYPVAGGGLLFLVWRRLIPRRKTPVADHDQQSDFLLGLRAVMPAEERFKFQQGRFSSFLDSLIPPLRRAEKIMGRWKVVGLSYLALCLYLLFLLL